LTIANAGFASIGLSNLVGCLALSCRSGGDFVAYTISAVLGPFFPFATPPGTGSFSDHISYAVVCSMTVVGVSLLFRKFSNRAALIAGAMVWASIGVFSLVLYHF
jgi:hypothetical protein